MTEDRYRLVTRSDFDGLVCAVLLKQLDLVGDIVFVHPKDVQDGQVEWRGRRCITVERDDSRRRQAVKAATPLAYRHQMFDQPGATSASGWR